MIKTKTRLFIVVTILAALTILTFNIKAEIKLYDILVELNGLVFDLLIFGILITVYEAANDKKGKITRYKEEINDYRHLKNETSSYRVIGIIKRLLELGEKEIDLSFSYLIRTFETPTKISNWSFVFSELFNCKFVSKHFDNCSFHSAHFKGVKFRYVNFSNCNFEFVIFESCEFSDCVFNDVNFDYAYIESKQWLTSITNKNDKLSKILEQYVISENTISIKKRNYHQLIDKSHNTKTAIDREVLQNQIFIELHNKTIRKTFDTQFAR